MVNGEWWVVNRKREVEKNLDMDHKEMDVWKQRMDLVEAVYTMSAQFPTDEVSDLPVK